MKNQELHRIVSTAIIVKNGKYLITQRSPHKKAYPNRWTVPGGGLETDDYTKAKKTTSDGWYFAVEKSLRREIKEEVNLGVSKINYLLDMTFIRPDKIPVIVLSFWCKYKSGKVKLDEDAIDYKWVSVKELKNYDIIEGIPEEIQMVDNIIKTGQAGKTEKKLRK